MARTLSAPSEPAPLSTTANPSPRAAEKRIDRRPLTARFSNGPGGELVAFDHKFAVRGNDVDANSHATWFPFFDFLDRHSSAPGEDFAQLAWVVERKLDHDQIGEPVTTRLRRSNC